MIPQNGGDRPSFEAFVRREVQELSRLVVEHEDATGTIRGVRTVPRLLIFSFDKAQATHSLPKIRERLCENGVDASDIIAVGSGAFEARHLFG